MLNEWLMNFLVDLVQRFSSLPMFFYFIFVVENFVPLPLPISFPPFFELSKLELK
jgi:hypothetical protein